MPTLTAMIDRLFVFCASLRLAVTTLLSLAFILGAATFYEARYGADAAQFMIYRSGWFAALLGVLAINIFAAAAIRYPFKRHQTGFVITHVGLLILLFGCVSGFHSSIDGVIAVREGGKSDHIRLKSEHFMLSHADDRQQARARVPVNLLTHGAYPTLWRYLASPVLGDPGEPRWREGKVLTLNPSEKLIEAIGEPVRLEVLDWYPASKTIDRIISAPDGAEHAAPAVRVVLEGSLPFEQPSASRSLGEFWLHGQANIGHHHAGMQAQSSTHRMGPMMATLTVLPSAEAAEAFLDYGAEATMPPGVTGLLEFAATPDGRLLARRFTQRGLEWGDAVETGTLYDGFMSIRFRVEQFLPRAIAERGYEKIDLPPGQAGIPAALVRLTVAGKATELWLARDGLPRMVPIAEPKIMSLIYGIDHMPLEFTLRLNRFERGTEPGTNMAASFASEVQLIDEEQNINEQHRIWMNNPLKHRGLKIYQSGFQELPEGGMLSIFAVNKDPGRPIKYTGSLLIVLGIFTMFYMRAYFFGRRRGGEDGAKPQAALWLLMLVLIPGADLAPGTLDAVRRMPVMHEGRVKPLDTVAIQTIRQITGRSRFGAAAEMNGELKVARKLDPVELLLALMADPQQWAHKPMIQVERLELREWLGMSASHTHISAAALDEHKEFRNRSRELFHRAAEIEREGGKFHPTPMEEAILDVARREGHFRAACGGSLLGLFPYPEDDAFFTWLDEQAQSPTPTMLGRQAIGHWRATASIEGAVERRAAFTHRAGWMPLSTLLASDPKELPPPVAERWVNAGALWAKALGAYHEGVNADHPMQILAAQLGEHTGATADKRQIDREVWYNRAHPFRWSMALYLLAAMGFAVATQVRAKAAYTASVTLLVAAIAVHGFGFYLRVRISGWAPVTNMYETVIWVAVVCALFGLMLELIYRSRMIGVAAGLVAGICTLVADIMPPSLGAEFRSLQPVLRSNFWLTTHVLTIVSSYAAFALALGLGNIALCFHLFAPNRKETLRRLSMFIYRAMQVGVLLVAAGTILGGVWADQSWGRFWGWDPKEVWALIVLLVYVAILHARFSGWIGNFGIAAVSVLAFQSVIMAWYGVNFVLGAGLHSYGFGTGGRLQVFSYVLFQCAFVLIVALKHRAAGGPGRSAELKVES